MSAQGRQRYIAFLRAVNVGGRIAKMEDVRRVFAEAGLPAARTHIQSGNVFFETGAADRAALTRKLERRLSGTFGFEITVFVRSVAEVESVLRRAPFAGIAVTPDVRPCVIFISAPLPAAARLPLRAPKGDFELLKATPGEVFAVNRRVDGRPANPAAFVEKTYKVRASARFYDTLQKIVTAAQGS
jgi:uncharacterized protein (DUF1697 family)